MMSDEEVEAWAGVDDVVRRGFEGVEPGVAMMAALDGPALP